MHRAFAFFTTAMIVAFHELEARDIEWVKEDVVRRGKETTVLIPLKNEALISGFFASSDGLVVTLASYLDGEHGVSVRTYTNEEIRGCKLLAIDSIHNLAVLSTGKRTPVFLEVHEQPVKSGSPCIVIYKTPEDSKAYDAIAFVRREAPYAARMGDTVCWSIAMSPSTGGFTGGPLISQDGKVVAICANVVPVRGKYPQRLVFGVPESAISSLLLRAKEAKGTIKFPKVGDNGGGQLFLTPLYQEGMRQYTNGDFVRASQSLLKALEERPKSDILLSNLAACMIAMGKPEEARMYIDKAVELNPQNLFYRGSLAEIVAAGGNITESIQHLKALTKEAPKFGLGWTMLADLLRVAGHKKEALGASEKATELDPDSIQVWQLHGEILLMAGQFKESSIARDRASELESLYFKLQYSAPKRQ